jgi:hypothetical protein
LRDLEARESTAKHKSALLGDGSDGGRENKIDRANRQSRPVQPRQATAAEVDYRHFDKSGRSLALLEHLSLWLRLLLNDEARWIR